MKKRPMNKNIIIFAPHQDDEIIGCGGMIQHIMRRQGNIYLVIATQSNDKIVEKRVNGRQQSNAEERNRECIRAAKILGIPKSRIHYLIASDYHMRLDSLDKISIVTLIEKFIMELNPSSIFIPANSLNQDHKVLNECLLTASRPHVYSGNIIEYEVENEINFRPNFYVPLSQNEIDKKIEALCLYQTQLKNGNATLNEEFIYTRAKYRGRELYVQYAEAFCIIRGRLYETSI